MLDSPSGNHHQMAGLSVTLQCTSVKLHSALNRELSTLTLINVMALTYNDTKYYFLNTEGWLINMGTGKFGKHFSEEQAKINCNFSPWMNYCLSYLLSNAGSNVRLWERHLINKQQRETVMKMIWDGRGRMKKGGVAVR